MYCNKNTHLHECTYNGGLWSVAQRSTLKYSFESIATRLENITCAEVCSNKFS